MKMSVRDGRSKTKLYGVWKSMRARCTHTSQENYSRYGGRGIGVSSEWLYFDNFRAWAENSGYAEGLQIDRIDNDGDYSPSNCRWVTASTNSRNTRRSRMLTVGGKTQTVVEWAEETGTRPGTILQRLNEYGWSEEDSVRGKRC